MTFLTAAVLAAVQFVSPETPKPWEKTASSELKDYLKRICTDEAVSVGGERDVVFHVGDTELAVSNGLSSATLKDEEWVIRSFGRDVVLNGGGTRGCLYAVYHFLEDQCNVRWWYGGEEDVPVVQTLDLPKLDRRGRPYFFYREIYSSDDSDPRYAVRNRVNGNGLSVIPPELGGGCVYGPPYHVHVWDRYLPFATYGKEHPEWYSLRDGVRVGGPGVGQLCLSCPGLAEVFAEKVEESIRAGEAAADAAGLPKPTLYDLSMNDNSCYCECAACKASQTKYGISGDQLRFENKVAEIVGRRHPDVRFTVLAYVEGEAVPRNGVRAAPNLIVKLTNTRQNMASGILEPDGRPMHDLMRDWNRFADNLLVWEYSITYGLGASDLRWGLPFASEFYIGEKLRYYAETGAKGIFFEHERYFEQTDLYALKYHLEAKMMEDPFQDATAVYRDFMSRYYGAAASEIEAARRLMDRRRHARGGFITWYPRPPEFNYLDDAAMREMNARWDAAEGAVADDPRRLLRVRHSRQSVRRLEQLKRRDVHLRKQAEKGVCDGPFVDCPAGGPQWMIKNAKIKVVADRDASTGKAVRMPFLDVNYKFPIRLGVYNPAREREELAVEISAPRGEGYQWYDLGAVRLPKESFYVFLNRNRFVQATVGLPELSGNRYNVRVRLRVAADAVYVDRVVFVPEK